jgi:hypothetical protein
MGRKYFGSDETWNRYFEECNSYKDLAVRCRISPEQVRESMLSEIESISRRIESERKELNDWLTYTPKTEQFKILSVQAIGYSAGTIFALLEEFEAINKLRWKLEFSYNGD